MHERISLDRAARRGRGRPGHRHSSLLPCESAAGRQRDDESHRGIHPRRRDGVLVARIQSSRGLRDRRRRNSLRDARCDLGGKFRPRCILELARWILRDESCDLRKRPHDTSGSGEIEVESPFARARWRRSHGSRGRGPRTRGPRRSLLLLPRPKRNRRYGSPLVRGGCFVDRAFRANRGRYLYESGGRRCRHRRQSDREHSRRRSAQPGGYRR